MIAALLGESPAGRQPRRGLISACLEAAADTNPATPHTEAAGTPG